MCSKKYNKRIGGTKMNPKSVVFIGSGKLMLTLIKNIKKNPMFKIDGVIIASNRIMSRDKKSFMTNVNGGKIEKNLRRMKINFEFIDEIRTLDNSDLLNKHRSTVFVLGWHSIVPPKILNKHDVFGFHASLLPKNAGWAPLVWSLIDGEKETGVTLFKLDEGIDTGSIIAQESFRIEEKDDIRKLLRKTKKAVKKICVHTSNQIASGTWIEQKQNFALRTVRDKREPMDGRIDFYKTCADIKNFVRAQSKPYPGAYIEFGDTHLIIDKIQIAENFIPTKVPGTPLVRGICIYIAACDGWMKIKRPRSLSQYLKLLFKIRTEFQSAEHYNNKIDSKKPLLDKETS